MESGRRSSEFNMQYTGQANEGAAVDGEGFAPYLKGRPSGLIAEGTTSQGQVERLCGRRRLSVVFRQEGSLCLKGQVVVEWDVGKCQWYGLVPREGRPLILS